MGRNVVADNTLVALTPDDRSGKPDGERYDGESCVEFFDYQRYELVVASDYCKEDCMDILLVILRRYLFVAGLAGCCRSYMGASLAGRIWLCGCCILRAMDLRLRSWIVYCWNVGTW